MVEMVKHIDEYNTKKKPVREKNQSPAQGNKTFDGKLQVKDFACFSFQKDYSQISHNQSLCIRLIRVIFQIFIW